MFNNHLIEEAIIDFVIVQSPLGMGHFLFSLSFNKVIQVYIIEPYKSSQHSLSQSEEKAIWEMERKRKTSCVLFNLEKGKTMLPSK